MTRASGIQLHGGWAVMLSLALTTFPSHADTLSYGYDANGNRISGDGQYYEYNDANRLARIRQGNASGPILAEFFYDHTGQRIKKIENGVTTYYIGKHFEANQQGYGTVNTNYYFAGTERVAKKENTGPLSFYHANHLGSTEAISDANGNLVNRTNYFPFGEIKQGGAEKYSFTGKERDVVSGQYYFEARYYASPFKHFTQADTIVQDAYNPQSLNRYSYVVNNPITNIDPTGHEWWKPWTWYAVQKAKESAQGVAQKTMAGAQYLASKTKEGARFVSQKFHDNLDTINTTKEELIKLSIDIGKAPFEDAAIAATKGIVWAIKSGRVTMPELQGAIKGSIQSKLAGSKIYGSFAGAVADYGAGLTLDAIEGRNYTNVIGLSSIPYLGPIFFRVGYAGEVVDSQGNTYVNGEFVGQCGCR